MNRPLSRRSCLIGALALATGEARAQPAPAVTIYKSTSCTCCQGWVDHMRQAGFRARVVTQEDVTPLFRKHGVPFELTSCHGAEVGGYLVVGHVPAADVRRLLTERPKAVGIAVPGMPWGSPGMEHPARQREPIETLLLLRGGGTRVFARHA